MKKRKIVSALVTLASALPGCVSNKTDFNNTKMYFDSSLPHPVSIWASDHDGIKQVTLSNRDGLVFVDNLNDSFIKNPTGYSVPIEINIEDGKYKVNITDKNGNIFTKQFTIKGSEITHP